MDPNLDNPTPNSTPETPAGSELADILAQLTSLKEDTNAAITGGLNRLSRQFEAKLAKLTSGNEETKPDPKPEAGETPKPDPTNPDPRYSALETQLKELAKRLEASNKEIEAEREQTKAERAKSEKAIATADLMNQLKDRVIDAKRFITLAEVEGRIEYVDGKWVTRDRDEILGDTITPITQIGKDKTDAVDRLLATDYALLAKSRPGSGTGASQSNATTPAAKSQYFGEGVDRAKLVAAYMEDSDKVTQDLFKTVGQ
jgi:hypothetical protein